MPESRRREPGCWLALAILLLLAALAWHLIDRMMDEHPEYFPWTELSLKDPIGPFTGIKLNALTEDADRCRGLLRAAGLSERPAPPFPVTERRCHFEDGVRVVAEDGQSIRYAPAGLVTSCPVAAALALWERDIVQPAARRHFGQAVARIDHAGSFSCRRLYGRSEGPFSEHATADAIDILGFRLADGRTIYVLGDWRDADRKAAFLREIRTGACDLFATVLSPDYNAAHADHFHLDQANRPMGWRMCR